MEEGAMTDDDGNPVHQKCIESPAEHLLHDQLEQLRERDPIEWALTCIDGREWDHAYQCMYGSVGSVLAAEVRRLRVEFDRVRGQLDDITAQLHSAIEQGAREADEMLELRAKLARVEALLSEMRESGDDPYVLQYWISKLADTLRD